MNKFLALDTHWLTIGELVRRAKGPMSVDVSDDCWALLARARAVVDDHAQRNVAVYGLTTGLGSNVSQRVEPINDGRLEEKIVLGRLVGIGEPLSPKICRAAFALRLFGLAKGAAGVSPSVIQVMIEMMNADILPAIPSFGSIGASDLGQCAAIAGCLLGHGKVWQKNKLEETSEALRRVGISIVKFQPKDALGIINSNAVTLAGIAHTTDELRRVLQIGVLAACTSFDAFGGNPTILRDDVHQLRQLPLTNEVASMYRELLKDSWIWEANSASAPQNALSYRTMVPSTASVLNAVETFVSLLEIDMNSATDNPAVLGDVSEMSSTPHFHTSALALAGDTLSIALTHWATASAHRTQKLISSTSSDLPRFLSPVGGTSVGFNALQKTLAALHAGIRFRAQPASCDALSISEGVEDIASQLPLVWEKLCEQVALLERLIAIEVLCAIQAMDLRKETRYGLGSKTLQGLVRSVIPPLTEDRALGIDVDTAVDLLARDASADLIGKLISDRWSDSILAR